MDDIKKKNEAFWKKKLTPEQYHVLREKGTERPFTGKFYKNFEDGMYHCAACGSQLFSSDTKFDSECGWPSFDRALSSDAVEFHDDRSFGMHRTEVLCKRCGSHLGHLFEDGPTETGQRYCINSLSLTFESKKK
jgi:peptide-methionine (R)-S-oxide reductase